MPTLRRTGRGPVAPRSNPSPTAQATRFIAPSRTSPTAKTPGMVVSNESGVRLIGETGVSAGPTPVRMKPRSSHRRTPTLRAGATPRRSSCSRLIHGRGFAYQSAPAAYPRPRLDSSLDPRGDNRGFDPRRSRFTVQFEDALLARAMSMPGQQSCMKAGITSVAKRCMLCRAASPLLMSTYLTPTACSACNPAMTSWGGPKRAWASVAPALSA